MTRDRRSQSAAMRGVPVSDDVLRAMQMTAGNQAVGRAIAEGRIKPDVSPDGPPAPDEAADPAPDQDP